jgi:hypothetical protein
MLNTYFHLFVQQSVSALLFFTIAWFLNLKHVKRYMKLKFIWFISGVCITAIIGATVRFFACFVIGDDNALYPKGNYGVFFSLAMPFVVSIAISQIMNIRLNRIHKTFDVQVED